MIIVWMDAPVTPGMVNILMIPDRYMLMHIDILMYGDILAHIYILVYVHIGIPAEIVVAEITATPVDRPALDRSRGAGPDFRLAGRSRACRTGGGSGGAGGIIDRPGRSASSSVIKSLGHTLCDRK